jgi:hypothetical protein
MKSLIIAAALAATTLAATAATCPTPERGQEPTIQVLRGARETSNYVRVLLAIENRGAAYEAVEISCVLSLGGEPVAEDRTWVDNVLAGARTIAGVSIRYSGGRVDGATCRFISGRAA